MAESATSDIAIPSDVLRKWQRIVDLLASIMKVPSAVVTTIGPPYASYTTIVSSASAGNPFPVDEIFSMNIGTFCETVIKSREPLLVANALEQDEFARAPEIGVGMVSYLGYPVLWPDGRMFGTICVLDDKANQYSEVYQELLSHCRDVLEGDLQTLTRLGHELEEQRAQLSELFARVPEAVVMVDRDFRIARLAWSYDSSKENDRSFGRKQSYVAGHPKNGVQFMVKHAGQYASTGGWLYAQFDDGQPVRDAAQLQTCFQCHQAVSARDYVFTRYAR